MPFLNEHACRIESPDKFESDSFRRITQGKIVIIVGKLTGGKKRTAQSFRYPVKDWSEAAARKHCKANNGTFEAAKKRGK